MSNLIRTIDPLLGCLLTIGQVLVISGLLGVFVIILTATWGIGLSPDSVIYIGASRNLLRGHGLRYVIFYLGFLVLSVLTVEQGAFDRRFPSAVYISLLLILACWIYRLSRLLREERVLQTT